MCVCVCVGGGGGGGLHGLVPRRLLLINIYARYNRAEHYGEDATGERDAWQNMLIWTSWSDLFKNCHSKVGFYCFISIL